MDRLCGDYLRKLTAKGGSPVEVAYAFQDFFSLPAFYQVPPERTKPFGTVPRGVCAVKDGLLESVHETKKIRLFPDGTLDPDSVVSMNFWGFAPSIFPAMETYFAEFLRHGAGTDRKAECLLPVMVDELVRSGSMKVSVLQSVDQWFGMTYQEDRPTVAAALKALHSAGIYPQSLPK